LQFLGGTHHQVLRALGNPPHRHPPRLSEPSHPLRRTQRPGAPQNHRSL